MDEYEFLTKIGMSVTEFVANKLTNRYQNKQELENDLSNVLQIIGEKNIDVKGIATFLANNGYVTISNSQILATDGFELASKKGGFSFENSSIFTNSGTGIRASGKGTGIEGRGNVSIRTKKSGADFTAG